MIVVPGLERCFWARCFVVNVEFLLAVLAIATVAANQADNRGYRPNGSLRGLFTPRVVPLVVHGVSCFLMLVLKVDAVVEFRRLVGSCPFAFRPDVDTNTSSKSNAKAGTANH